MNIPEEAIEKAAEALHFWRGHVVPWENMHDAAKDGWRAEARATLSAAAPHLMAMAWDEGVGYVSDHAEDLYPANPYRTKERP